MTEHERLMIEELMKVNENVEQCGFLDIQSAKDLIGTCAHLILERENVNKQLFYSLQNGGEFLETLREYQ